MVEFEVAIPDHHDATSVQSTVEECAARIGLRPTMKGTLARYPGCTHWHFKRGPEPGTLEVTWWPRERRLWLSVQSGRIGKWIEAVVPEFKAGLEDPASW